MLLSVCVLRADQGVGEPVHLVKLGHDLVLGHTEELGLESGHVVVGLVGPGYDLPGHKEQLGIKSGHLVEIVEPDYYLPGHKGELGFVVGFVGPGHNLLGYKGKICLESPHVVWTLA